VRVNLPPELVALFEVLGEVASGGESDVLLVRRRGDGGRSAALKIYRHGLEPDPEALALIRALPREHVVEIYDCGRSGAGWWEEQEYIEHGSLAELFAAEGPRLAAERLREVIVELTGALEAVHPVLHRDVKPTNVFVRTVEPLDLVLGDFGLARSTAFTHIVSTVAGSLAYQSPEALDGGASPARDWWAVGMMIAEASIGRHPFFDPGLGWPPAAEMRIALTTRPVPLDGVEDERVRMLCRGLLVRDPRRRWGAAEVRSWLDGGAPAIADEGETLSVGSRAAAIQPFVFAGQRCTTPEQLAPLLAQHWDDALRLISGAASEAPDYVRLAGWLEDHHHEPALRVLEQAARDRSVARRLFRLSRALDAGLPPSFRGRLIDRESLLALAAAAAAGDGEAQLIVYDIFELGIVGELAREDRFENLVGVEERWRVELELVPRLRDDLGTLGHPLDNDDVLRAIRSRTLLALLDEGAMEELATNVGEASQPALLRNDETRKVFERVRGDGTQPIRLIAAMLALEPARERYEQELAQQRTARSMREEARASLAAARAAIEDGLQAAGPSTAQVLRGDTDRMLETAAYLASAIDAIPDDIDSALAAQERLRVLSVDATELERQAQAWERDPLAAALARTPELVADCEAAGVADLQHACATVLERDEFPTRSRALWEAYSDAVASARGVGVRPQRQLSAAPAGDDAVALFKWWVSARAEAPSIVEDLLNRVSSSAPVAPSVGSAPSRADAFWPAIAVTVGLMVALCLVVGAALGLSAGYSFILLASPFAWGIAWVVWGVVHGRFEESVGETWQKRQAEARASYEREASGIERARVSLQAAREALDAVSREAAASELQLQQLSHSTQEATHFDGVTGDVGASAMLMTTLGAIGIELSRAPSGDAVGVFARLARRGFYNGIPLQRVVGNSAIVASQRTTKAMSPELVDATDHQVASAGSTQLERGLVAMRRNGPRGDPPEFFIVTAERITWASTVTHEVLGRVTSGMFVCDRISDGASEARIESIHVASA
jgi:cyclophilin family peptidyl-prolyl cis-trans isomerase